MLCKAILDFRPCVAVDRFDICLQLCPLSETGRGCLEEERGKQEQNTLKLKSVIFNFFRMGS